MPLEFTPPLPNNPSSGVIPSAPATANPKRFKASRWLSMLTGLSVIVATIAVWQALRLQERSRIANAAAYQVEGVKSAIAARMESRLLALVRMGRRWELRGQPPWSEWESDAMLYVQHDAGYSAIAWVDPLSQVRWQVRRDPARARIPVLLPSDAGAALNAARDQNRITLTRVSRLATGEQVFATNIPIFAEQRFSGWLVGIFEVQPLLDEILGEHVAPGYGIGIAEGGRSIYRRGPPPTPVLQASGQVGDIDYQGLKWQVQVSPLPLVLEAAHSPLPSSVLVGGLVLALLLAVSVHLAQIARVRAHDAEEANEELKRQIADRRNAQERVRKLSRAVEQSPIMVLITDTRGAIEYVNPRFSQVTGYALEEVLGKNPRILKSGETPDEVYRHLWATITSGGEWHGELHNRKKNGEQFWEHVAISPIRDESGNVTHFVAEMEDITERKRLEQEVADHNREIAKTQALAAMGQAATMIAHDLRNPLSTIKMNLQILGRSAGAPLSNTENELRQIAMEQVRYMEEVLSDLLAYSYPAQLEPEWLNIDKILEAAILLAQREIEEHRVRVETHYHPGLPTLHGDPNRLRRAFSNLIANAAQGTEGVNGRLPIVHIHTGLQFARDAAEIRVEIHDNGGGIPAGITDRVLEPFFTTRAKGTGLGLPIANRIVSQHRGRLELRSEPDGGTRVIVMLPTGPLQP